MRCAPRVQPSGESPDAAKKACRLSFPKSAANDALTVEILDILLGFVVCETDGMEQPPWIEQLLAEVLENNDDFLRFHLVKMKRPLLSLLRYCKKFEKEAWKRCRQICSSSVAASAFQLKSEG